MSNFNLNDKLIHEKIYITALGESKTKNQWEKWAINFYEELKKEGHNQELPKDWFEKISKIFKLVEL